MSKRFILMLLFLLGPALKANGNPLLCREWSGSSWHLQSRRAGQWTSSRKSTSMSEEIGSTSVIIVQHGVVVAEWGDVAHQSNLHSCRKSLLNSLIGIAVAEGKINLNNTLEKLGVDDNKPSHTDVEKQATVRDLLEARSGVYHPTDYETKGMIEKKPPRGSHAPGTFRYCNNWDFDTLGYIYEHATGTKIFESFYREIAQPIGMQDFPPHDGQYFTSADSRFPAYPFDMRARD
jgi:CubicO group peptidase (beta-lactamase class C family)